MISSKEIERIKINVSLLKIKNINSLIEKPQDESWVSEKPVHARGKE